MVSKPDWASTFLSRSIGGISFAHPRVAKTFIVFLHQLALGAEIERSRDEVSSAERKISLDHHSNWEINPQGLMRGSIASPGRY